MGKLIWLGLAVGALSVGAAGCTSDDTYAACIDDLDCNDLDDQCWEVDIEGDVTGPRTFGGFCSHQCDADFDCEFNFGFDGVCYALESDPTFLCYQQCEFNEDCWSGNVCREFSLGGGLIDFVCVPDNF